MSETIKVTGEMIILAEIVKDKYDEWQTSLENSKKAENKYHVAEYKFYKCVDNKINPFQLLSMLDKKD